MKGTLKKLGAVGVKGGKLYMRKGNNRDKTIALGLWGSALKRHIVLSCFAVIKPS